MVYIYPYCVSRYHSGFSCAEIVYFTSHTNVPSVIALNFTRVESCIVYGIDVNLTTEKPYVTGSSMLIGT